MWGETGQFSPDTWYQPKIIEVDPDIGIINEVALPNIANILFIELDDGRVLITGGRNVDLSESTYPYLNAAQSTRQSSLKTFFYHPLGQ